MNYFQKSPLYLLPLFTLALSGCFEATVLVPETTTSNSATEAAATTTCGATSKLANFYTNSKGWEAVTNVTFDQSGNGYVAETIYNLATKGLDSRVSYITDCGKTSTNLLSLVYDGKAITTNNNLISTMYVDTNGYLFVAAKLGFSALGAAADLITTIYVYKAGKLIAQTALAEKSEAYSTFVSDGKTVSYFSNFFDGTVYQVGAYALNFDSLKGTLNPKMSGKLYDDKAAGANGSNAMSAVWDAKNRVYLIGLYSHDRSGKCMACNYVGLYMVSAELTVASALIGGTASANIAANNYYYTPFIFLTQDSKGASYLAYPVTDGAGGYGADLMYTADLKTMSYSALIAAKGSTVYLTGMNLYNDKVYFSVLNSNKAGTQGEIYSTDLKTSTLLTPFVSANAYQELWGFQFAGGNLYGFGAAMNADGATTTNLVDYMLAP